VQFTISRATHQKLRRAQDLLRHSIPDGDPAKIFDKALTVLLAHVEKKKLAAAVKPRQTNNPAPRSTRHIPANVRRAVWKRDDGRCAFVGNAGRCDERGFLEFHHRQPFACGGLTTVDNMELRCRARNAYEAELFFEPFIAREDRAEFSVSSGTRSGTTLSHRRRAADERGRRPPPLRTPGNRSRLVPYRSRGEYGCLWTTHVRRTDAPAGPLGSTRITEAELAAQNRRARFPAAPCGGVLRIASAGDPARPLLGRRRPHQRK
jgi:hypothetical protein